MNIRNFTIIAHIDHGKSTLSDRLIEKCHAISERKMSDRILDSMDLEKERGITIKSQTVRLEYKAKNGETYYLNLMDTPGHVDFSYEVDRCMYACEGSLLLVDATQGVQAQTLSNAYKAIARNHKMIVVINKVDIVSADVDACIEQIRNVLGINDDPILISAKTGYGIDNLIEAIIERIPQPQLSKYHSPLKALLMDSWYDKYLGVIMIVRIYDGYLSTAYDLVTLSNDEVFKATEIGYMCIDRIPSTVLKAGEVGYIISNIEQTKCKIGDTITYAQQRCSEPIEGFRERTPVVFCSIFPESGETEKLREILEKLKLNDGFSYKMHTSPVLGSGFRCGFSGLLHMDIFLSRIEREFQFGVIPTVSNVEYKIICKEKNLIKEYFINNPEEMPEKNVLHIEEQIIKAKVELYNSHDTVSKLMNFLRETKCEESELLVEYTDNKVIFEFDMPLNEIVSNFYDKIKSITSGYATFDYEVNRYQVSDIVVLSILVNDEVVAPLSCFVHRRNAQKVGRIICAKLKELIDRHVFEVKIQAAVGGKKICTEVLSAARKDVIGHLYGGDVTRKKKLLEKQKKGQALRGKHGTVHIKSSALKNVLKGS